MKKQQLQNELEKLDARRAEIVAELEWTAQATPSGQSGRPNEEAS